MSRFFTFRAASAVLGLIAAIAAWEFLIRFFAVPKYVWPAPLQVATYILTAYETYAWDFAYTLAESLAGLAIAAGIAIIITSIAIYVAPARVMFRAGAAILQSIPILAFAPFLIAWFGPYIGSKIAAAVLVTLPILVTALLSEYANIPAEEHWFASSMLGTRGAAFFRFLLPRLTPSFVAALRIAAPLACLGAIVGEFVGASVGLGFRILSGSYYLRTDEMLAGVAGAVVISLSLVALLQAYENKYCQWRQRRNA